MGSVVCVVTCDVGNVVWSGVLSQLRLCFGSVVSLCREEMNLENLKTDLKFYLLKVPENIVDLIRKNGATARSSCSCMALLVFDAPEDTYLPIVHAVVCAVHGLCTNAPYPHEKQATLGS